MCKTVRGADDELLEGVARNEVPGRTGVGLCVVTRRSRARTLVFVEAVRGAGHFARRDARGYSNLGLMASRIGLDHEFDAEFTARGVSEGGDEQFEVVRPDALARNAVRNGQGQHVVVDRNRLHSTKAGIPGCLRKLAAEVLCTTVPDVVGGHTPDWRIVHRHIHRCGETGKEGHFTSGTAAQHNGEVTGGGPAVHVTAVSVDARCGGERTTGVGKRQGKRHDSATFPQGFPQAMDDRIARISTGVIESASTPVGFPRFVASPPHDVRVITWAYPSGGKRETHVSTEQPEA